jgi:hypothetical protein
MLTHLSLRGLQKIQMNKQVEEMQRARHPGKAQALVPSQGTQPSTHIHIFDHMEDL